MNKMSPLQSVRNKLNEYVIMKAELIIQVNYLFNVEVKRTKDIVKAIEIY